MGGVKKAVKKVGKVVGGAIGGLFKAPKVVVNDNSQEVANAINKQAEEEKAAKAEADLKEEQEKKFRERVEADQKALNSKKPVGTTDTTESDLATSGLNNVNADFSKTLIENEDEKKKRRDALLGFMSSGR